MAAFGIGILFAPIVGPTLGGWITDNYSWRWIFYLNLPVGVFSIAMISRFVSDPSYIKRGAGRIDLWGIGLLAVGLGALQVVLDTGQRKDWFSSDYIRFFAVLAVAGLVSLVIRELMVKEPIVDLRALANRTFSAGVFLITQVGFVLYASLVLLPLYLQTLAGISRLQCRTRFVSARHRLPGHHALDGIPDQQDRSAQDHRCRSHPGRHHHV